MDDSLGASGGHHATDYIWLIFVLSQKLTGLVCLLQALPNKAKRTTMSSLRPETYWQPRQMSPDHLINHNWLRFFKADSVFQGLGKQDPVQPVVSFHRLKLKLWSAAEGTRRWGWGPGEDRVRTKVWTPGLESFYLVLSFIEECTLV